LFYITISITYSEKRVWHRARMVNAGSPSWE
jgi:hypothetical protein